MARYLAELCLAVAAIPFIYHLISLYSSWKFFSHSNAKRYELRVSLLR